MSLTHTRDGDLRDPTVALARGTDIDLTHFALNFTRAQTNTETGVAIKSRRAGLRLPIIISDANA